MVRLVTIEGHTPDVARAAFIAPGVVIAGDVTLEEGVSIWYGTVIRAEMTPVVIGAGTNVQDNSVIHTDAGFPTTIGARVTLGHRCLVHGATIEDDVLVGMAAVVLNGAAVGEGSLVGAGAVVRERFVVPPASLALGVPAQVRALPEGVSAPFPNADAYAWLAGLYAEADPGRS